MARIIRSPECEEDLISIWCYIARDNPEAADKTLLELDEASEFLVTYPLAGKRRDEILPDLRSFPKNNYIIFYLPEEDGVSIVRILHAARYARDLL